MKFRFLYHDQPASQKTIASYVVGDYFHENDHVAASLLRGGLLTGCNLRYIFITNVKDGTILANEDYKKQGLFIFDHTLYYGV